METTNNIVKLIRDNSDDGFIINLIKHELEWRLYDYGEHLVSERQGHVSLLSELNNLRKLILSKKEDTAYNKGRILSFLPDVDALLENDGFIPYSHVYYRKSACAIKSWRFLIYKYRLESVLRTHEFNKIIYQDISLFKEYYTYLKDLILEYDFKALIVTTDQWFLQRSAIEAFKELGRPTILFTHGLPGMYNLDLDNKTDYLFTWGDAIRQNYIKTGFDPSKIFVTGNSKYQKSFEKILIKWSDEHIVVVPESSFVYHQHTYGEPMCPDRTRMIVYLYEVEYILKSLGYKKARFRPHPSLNWEWFVKFVDTDFYTLDYKLLKESINNTTLVIGATSSVILEYVMAGINCLVYERPKPITYSPLVPPFDGNDPRIPYARTPDQLEDLIKRKVLIDSSVFDDYIHKFERELILKVINDAIMK